MDVVITLTFHDMNSYTRWLESQVEGIQRAALGVTDASLSTGELDDVSGAVANITPTKDTRDKMDAVADKMEKAKSAKRQRKPRKAKKEAAPENAVAPSTEEVLPTAPATEAAPTEGEKKYTLADSREVLTAYLAKSCNGAESLLKELKVHKAKRINEVPAEHVHGFLKRMVEAS